VKILISSHAFSPSIGGIETVSELLAGEFVRLGHEVSLLTQTPAQEPRSFPYLVTRQSSISELGQALAWSDIFWQNNLSLRTLWPVMFVRRPVVVTHQGSYCRKPAGLDIPQRLKHATVSHYPSVAISKAVADCFQVRSVVIPNPYDSELFRLSTGSVERDRDLIFLGRLVSEKGIDLLLQSLGKLKARQLSPCLTIVGQGPEQNHLEQLTAELGLGGQVTFAGALQGASLATVLRRHKILVVPSRYDEPFGVVALEGIACGCVVVGSNGGGLPEAIGPCGVTFPNGDVETLSEKLASLLLQSGACDRLRAHAPAHLANFQPGTIARKYLDLFQELL
jgi:glycosyltransferase involved in cell wall biosynthesis